MSTSHPGTMRILATAYFGDETISFRLLVPLDKVNDNDFIFSKMKSLVNEVIRQNSNSSGVEVRIMPMPEVSARTTTIKF